MATLTQIKCGLCSSIGSLFNHRCYGIKCNEDFYLDKAHRYYKYQWMKEHVSCGTDKQIDCLINEES